MSNRTNLPSISTNTPTRRQIIAGGAIGLCGLAVVGTKADAQNAATDSAKAPNIVATKAIHQEENFQASPHRIYEALLDSKQFTAFSGGRAAEIDRTVGGAFTIFAGHIVGRNLELVPDRRIVQAWRVVPWPEGIFSIARFELIAQGSGTRVIFDHTGFPSELAEHLESGWNENYWKALQKYLG
jgi:activator of HSP90 ATPase